MDADVLIVGAGAAGAGAAGAAVSNKTRKGQNILM
jgi:thioredoxin reductase